MVLYGIFFNKCPIATSSDLVEWSLLNNMIYLQMKNHLCQMQWNWAIGFLALYIKACKRDQIPNHEVMP